MDLMCSAEIVDIRKKVEEKFEIRLVSCIDAVNKCRDDRALCMDSTSVEVKEVV